MIFNKKINSICKEKNSHVCVGLDVDINKIPPFLRTESNPLVVFCKAIIDATIEYTAVYKINIAFFEAYGIKGWQALKEIVDYLPASVIKIADAKRGDIGNTSKMYAKAFFEELSFDSITVNPYLGYDSVAPFLDNPEKGAFILCVTSNKGSFDFQRIYDGSNYLYEKVAAKIVRWNKNNNCGLVVGATHPDELKIVRNITPGLPFLIPGIGAQGGDLQNSVQNAFIGPNDCAVFNSSRGIIYSSNDKDFAEVAAQKAMELRDSINQLKMLH